VNDEEEESEGANNGAGGAAQGTLSDLGSYLGSWMGMSSVPEGQEQADTGVISSVGSCLLVTQET